MKFNIDPNATEERSTGFELLEVGDYRATVPAPPEVKVDRNGNPYWMVTLKIIEPAGIDREVRAFIFFHFDTKRQGDTMLDLQALGFDVKPGYSGEINESECVGRTCGVRVNSHRSYKDKDGKDRKAENLTLFPDPGPGKLADPPKQEPPKEAEIPF